MTLSPQYLAWRESPRGLNGIARILHEGGELAREEALDLHEKLGALLGVGKRGGVQTVERWVPCGKKKRARCATCQSTPGHGPYLYRKDGKRWVRVPETDAQQAERRRRALDDVRKVETQHALALLEAAHDEASGFLTGPKAEEAERRIRASIHS